MSARYLVIDGHSVIFAWPDLRKLHDQNRTVARKALIDRLQHLHDTTDWRVTVVLDGKLGTAISSGERSSAISNCPVAFVARSALTAHSLEPAASSLMRPRSV